MCIQEEIWQQCHLTREENWRKMLDRTMDWATEAGVGDAEFNDRLEQRDQLVQAWHSLGCPESTVRWPGGIRFADVELLDVSAPFNINAANSPKDVATLWVDYLVPGDADCWVTEQTGWLPVLIDLVFEYLTTDSQEPATVALVCDDHGGKLLWLQLRKSGIRKLRQHLPQEAAAQPAEPTAIVTGSHSGSLPASASPDTRGRPHGPGPGIRDQSSGSRSSSRATSVSRQPPPAASRCSFPQSRLPRATSSRASVRKSGQVFPFTMWLMVGALTPARAAIRRSGLQPISFLSRLASAAARWASGGASGARGPSGQLLSGA